MRLKTSILQILFLITVTLWVSCGGMGKPTTKTVKYPNQVTGEMRVRFDEAESLYRRRQYDEAFQKYQEYIETFGYNRLTDESYYKQGKLFFLRKDFLNAIQKFDELARKTPSPKYHSKANHFSGYAYYKRQNMAEALDRFKNVEGDLLPPKLRLQYYSLVVLSSQATDQERDLANFATLKLYDLYEGYNKGFASLRAPDVLSPGQVTKLLQAWMATAMSPSDIKKWMQSYPSGAAKPYVDYKIAKIYSEAGDSKKARRYLTVFVQSHPKNEYYAQAVALLEQLGGPEELNLKTNVKFKVGVLAAMGGQRAGFGESLIKGLRCGLQASVCGPDSGAGVITKDSGLTPDGVRAAIDSLKSDGVSAIVGILPGSLSVEAAAYATQQKVPMFLVSQKRELMRQGDYAFQLGLDPRQMVRDLVQRARSKGYRSFAIFYPDIRYGETMVDLFTKEVMEQGGKVVAKSAYNRGTKDPFADARRFKVNIKLSGQGHYDAIFLPDTYRAVNVMVQALQFNGIKGVPILGTNTWNNEQLTGALSKEFPGSFFVDLYNARSASLENKQFQDHFRAGFGESPQVLHALGYDAGRFIRQAVSAEGSRGVFKAVSNGMSFRGVTGIRGFKIGQEAIVQAYTIPVR